MTFKYKRFKKIRNNHKWDTPIIIRESKDPRIIYHIEQKDFTKNIIRTYKDINNMYEDDHREEKIAINYHCLRWISEWLYDWKKDLNLRPQYAATSSLGYQAYNDFMKTKKALNYLFNELKTNALKKEVKNGIWPMILAMKKKNYKTANAILLNSIAIGNAPWPIGVTQVGIHTKSAAREKISTSHLNKNAAAHIMGDEATRKYLHALKQLLTVVQRLYPNDPSACVDFNKDVDLAKGTWRTRSLKHASLTVETSNQIS
jgi:pre-mRNA-splicing factor 18